VVNARTHFPKAQPWTQGCIFLGLSEGGKGFLLLPKMLWGCCTSTIQGFEQIIIVEWLH
jgi:hypothetical protein